MGLRAEAELFHTTSALRSTLSSTPSFPTGTAAIVKYQQYLSCIPFRQHLLSEALPDPLPYTPSMTEVKSASC